MLDFVEGREADRILRHDCIVEKRRIRVNPAGFLHQLGSPLSICSDGISFLPDYELFLALRLFRLRVFKRYSCLRRALTRSLCLAHFSFLYFLRYAQKQVPIVPSTASTSPKLQNFVFGCSATKNLSQWRHLFARQLFPASQRSAR